MPKLKPTLAREQPAFSNSPTIQAGRELDALLAAARTSPPPGGGWYAGKVTLRSTENRSYQVPCPCLGWLAVHPGVWEQQGRWVVTAMRICRRLITVRSEEAAMSVASYVDRHCPQPFAETSWERTVGLCPLWLCPWILAVNSTGAWVNPLPYRKANAGRE